MRVARPTRLAVAVAVAWTGVAIGMFLNFSDRLDTHDGLRWLVLGLCATQIPAFWATISARRQQLFGTGRAVAVAVPSALAAVYAGFSVFVIALSPITGHLTGEISPELGLAYAFVMIGMVVASYLYFYGVLRRRPHPAGLVRVLTIVTVLGVLCVAVSALVGVRIAATRPSSEPSLGAWFVIGLPLLWTLPLWLAHRASALAAAPIAPARIVD